MTLVKTVFLDIDGTLMDTNYLHVEAWGLAFEEVGARPPRSRIHHQVGKGSDKLIPEFVEDGQKAERVSELHSKYYAELQERGHPLPGAKELIASLVEGGYEVWLATSAKPEELEHHMRELGAEGKISGVVSSDEAEESKPAPDIFGVALERDKIRKEIEAYGYNERTGSYTRTFDGEEMDASLLTLPLYGYIEGEHPRMRSTCARIHEKLARDGLIYRYETGIDDGLPPGEGTFGICSFWAVECLARVGDVEGATQAFEHLLSYVNDVGLFAEEIDPDTGAALGNFPQAFTHIGLINAALTLAEYGDKHTFVRGDRPPTEKGLEDHT
jgi:phosphoglycolate phosphatase-like HAD superfamily hydrolase